MSKRQDLNARRLSSLCALSAAAVAGGLAQSAEAGIVVTDVNQAIGFGSGNSQIALLPIGGVRFGVTTSTFGGFSRSLIVGGTVNANFKVKTQMFGGFQFARPLDAGVTFGAAPGGSPGAAYIEFASSSGAALGPGAFTDKYYAFSFGASGSERYGWVLGSLTNTTYSGLSYTIKSYAYEDTGVMIATGQRTLGTAAVPLPSSVSLGLVSGALVLGAKGVRALKKAKKAA